MLDFFSRFKEAFTTLLILVLLIFGFFGLLYLGAYLLFLTAITWWGIFPLILYVMVVVSLGVAGATS